MKKNVLVAAVIAAFALPSGAMACSGCGCNLDMDEDAVGIGPGAGWSVDERIDFVNQNALWQGSSRANAALSDPTGDQHEVQRNTATMFYTTTLDYQSSGDWGVNVAVPVQYRDNSTFNTGTLEASKSSWNAVDDVRVLGRYALTEGKTFNVLTGMKLPTGATTHNFDSGPSAGTLVDRGLQPGTGTWDLLLGLNQNCKITDRLGWFSQQMWQKPLEQHNNFSEGQKLNGSVGLRYTVDEVFTPQFQINAQNRWRDRGLNADTPNSGGEVVYASPGLSVNVVENTAVYGFVQVPVYQRVGGLELVQGYSASVGIKHKF